MIGSPAKGGARKIEEQCPIPARTYGARGPLRHASADLATHNRGAVRQRLKLGEGEVAWKVFHAAIGRGDQLFRRQLFEARTDAVRYLVGRLRAIASEVQHPEQNGLVREVLQNA